MRQYPHLLFTKPALLPTRDPNGDYIPSPGSESFVLAGPCRQETNGTGQTVVLPDASVSVFAAVIYAPLSIPSPATGTTVQIAETSGVVRLSNLTVKQVDRGQLHLRIWL